MLNTDIHIYIYIYIYVYIYIYIHLYSYIRCGFTSTQNSPLNRHLLAKYDFSVKNTQLRLESYVCGDLSMIIKMKKNDEWKKKDDDYQLWGETLVLEFLFKKVVLKNLLRKRLQHGRFPVNVLKFWRKPILKNICERLLLKFITAVLT